jgi:hypothetical protein
VCCAQTTAGVTIEKLIEPDVIPPMWIMVDHVIATVDGTSAILITNKQMSQSVLDLFGYMSEMHFFS